MNMIILTDTFKERIIHHLFHAHFSHFGWKSQQLGHLHTFSSIPPLPFCLKKNTAFCQAKRCSLTKNQTTHLGKKICIYIYIYQLTKPLVPKISFGEVFVKYDLTNFTMLCGVVSNVNPQRDPTKPSQSDLELLGQICR